LDGYEEQDGDYHQRLRRQFHRELWFVSFLIVFRMLPQQIAAFVVPLLVIVGWM